MNKLKVLFMGTPDFAVPCLEQIYQDGHEIVGVITQPDRPKGRGQKLLYSPIKEFALTKALTVYQPERIKTADFVDFLKTFSIDVIVVVAFGQILSKEILDLPRYGSINVHASLLPKYRGAAPIHWSVINGETETGITTMFMDIGLDTGDMIQTKKVTIMPDETTGELYDRLKALGAQTLSETLNILVQNKTLPREPQNNSEATYAPLLTRELERINWTDSAKNIHNLVRGLNPWPGSFCTCLDKPLKIWQTKVSNVNTSEVPGTIIDITSTGILVSTGQGVLELIEVQPANKKRMSALEFHRGYGIKIGTKL